jgi:hypothetical protein
MCQRLRFDEVHSRGSCGRKLQHMLSVPTIGNRIKEDFHTPLARRLEGALAAGRPSPGQLGDCNVGVRSW